MPFNQAAPQLGNQFTTDAALNSYLARALPAEVLREMEAQLHEMGELAGGELYRLQLADRANEPQLTTWDAWGNRIDAIELTPLWRHVEPIAARRGLIAIAYDRAHGRHSRVHQFALVYLFAASTDVYSCPLAMTDGATKTLLTSGNRALIERAVPHLTSREPSQFWTSGQWMTESTGGSDVGLSETIARKDSSGAWRLHGRKWFTSAATSNIALTLARPEGNASGGRGLALFYLEPRDEYGRLRNILVHRLKDKLGTRKVPTAELTLDGAPATLVMGESDGIKNIAPMLNITRVWNSVNAVSLMRRGLALARDYAHRRVAFGAPLADKALHLDTLAGLQAETEAALQLTFCAVEMLGAEEAGDAGVHDLLRLLTPIVKLTTGKQALAVTSEVLECFGGAGYVEDTGLPMLLRDAQVLPIWEGTTNVLSLDTLRALAGAAWDAYQRLVQDCLQDLRDQRLCALGARVAAALEHAAAWLQRATRDGGVEVEFGARRFALTLGRTLACALLARQAQWSLDRQGDARVSAAAQRFLQNGIDLIGEHDSVAARALALEETIPDTK